MISFFTILSLILVLVIVAVVAWHLIGIFIALKRGADHLQQLAGGLVAIRDNTVPLNGKVDEINAGLTELVSPLLAANGNLAAIVTVAGSRR